MKKHRIPLLFILFSCLHYASATGEAMSITNTEVILSGEDYHNYMEDLDVEVKALFEEIQGEGGQSSPMSDAFNDAMTDNTETVIYQFDNLLQLKQSPDLPDWIKSETLEDHGFTMASPDAEIDVKLDETIAIDSNMLALIDDNTPPEGAQAAWFCGKKKKNKTKSFGSIKPFSKTDSFGVVNISGDADVSGHVRYRQYSRCGIVYKVSYKGIDLKVKLGLEDSNVSLLDFSLHYSQTLFNLSLFSGDYNWGVWAGPIYISGKHDIDLDFLIDFYLGVFLKIEKNYNMTGDITYDITCSRNNCNVKDSQSSIGVNAMDAGLAYSLSSIVTLTPKINLDTKHRLYVYGGKTLEVKTHTGIATPLTYYQYFGNTCSPAFGYLSDANMVYMDLMITGWIRVDSLVSAAKKFNIDLGMERVKFDEVLADRFNFSNGAYVHYKNVFFSGNNTTNFFNPVVSISNNPDYDIEARLSTPQCLPTDLRMRGATYSVDWGDGTARQTVKTTSHSVNASALAQHVFADNPANANVNATLTKLGRISIKKDNTSKINYVSGQWQTEQAALHPALLIPVLGLLL